MFSTFRNHCRRSFRGKSSALKHEKMDANYNISSSIAAAWIYYPTIRCSIKRRNEVATQKAHLRRKSFAQGVTLQTTGMLIGSPNGVRFIRICPSTVQHGDFFRFTQRIYPLAFIAGVQREDPKKLARF